MSRVQTSSISAQRRLHRRRVCWRRAAGADAARDRRRPIAWAHQLLHLAECGYCAAAWDARGYGDSDDYDGPLSFTEMARDLSNVLDAFAVDKSHMCRGTSMGGRISLETYANFPDRFASLTLAGVHARFEAFSPGNSTQFRPNWRKPLIQGGLSPADLAPKIIRNLAGPNAPGLEIPGDRGDVGLRDSMQGRWIDDEIRPRTCAVGARSADPGDRRRIRPSDAARPDARRVPKPSMARTII